MAARDIADFFRRGSVATVAVADGVDNRDSLAGLLKIVERRRRADANLDELNNRWYQIWVEDIRSRFVGCLPPGATILEVIELLGEPEGLGNLSRGQKMMGYRDMTLQMFFTYGRLDLIGCYFDRGDQTPRDWPGPIQVAAELHRGVTEEELKHWLDAQGHDWAQVTAGGGVTFYKLGEDVSFHLSDGSLASMFIHCGLPTMGRDELLEVGVQLAARIGLENLTLGNLAEVVCHSKSWIAHHFKTKERLRLAVEAHYHK